MWGSIVQPMYAAEQRNSEISEKMGFMVPVNKKFLSVINFVMFPLSTHNLVKKKKNNFQ